MANEVRVHAYTHDQREENKEYYYSKTKKEIYSLKCLTHTHTVFIHMYNTQGWAYADLQYICHAHMHLHTSSCCTKILNCKA